MHRSREFRKISNQNVRDLMNISASSATRLLNLIRTHFGKVAGTPVFLLEFCEYTKFNVDKVCAFFNWD